MSEVPVLQAVVWLLSVIGSVLAAASTMIVGVFGAVWGAIGLWTVLYLGLAIGLTYAVSYLIIEGRDADLSWCFVAGEFSRNISIVVSLSAFISRGAKGLTDSTTFLEILPHAFVGAVIGLLLGLAFQLLAEITANDESSSLSTVRAVRGAVISVLADWRQSSGAAPERSNSAHLHPGLLEQGGTSANGPSATAYVAGGTNEKP